MLPVLTALALLLSALFLLFFKTTPAAVSAPSDQERLILYTSLDEEVIASLAREFETCTGIWVSVEHGPSRAELSRLSSGEPAGWDVILAPEDALEEYGDLFVPASELGSLQTAASQTVFPCALTHMAIIYNTKLVRLYPPDGWQSLLDPVWKGRLAFPDPQTTGEGFAFFQAIEKTLSRRKAFSDGQLSQALEGPCFSDMRELIRAVADGTYYIGVVSEDAALRAAASGYDITIVRPQESTPPIREAAAVLKDSPHQENAKAFLDFLTEERVQSCLQERFFFSPIKEQKSSAGEVRP